MTEFEPFWNFIAYERRAQPDASANVGPAARHGTSLTLAMTTSYRSAVDFTIGGLVFGIPAMLVLVGISLLFFTTAGGVITIISGLVCGSLIPILFYPCVYLITDSGIRIKYGLFDKEISFAEIEKVELSEDAWSSPALSLKRVKIKYRDTFTMVSPPNREEFMVVLKSKLP